MWGVFEKDEEVHIIPCDNDGYKFKEHEKNLDCKCQPEIVETFENGKMLISHNMLH